MIVSDWVEVDVSTFSFSRNIVFISVILCSFVQSKELLFAWSDSQDISLQGSDKTLITYLEADCPCSASASICTMGISYAVSIIEAKTGNTLWGYEYHKVVHDNTCRFFLILGRQLPIPDTILQKSASELRIQLDSAYLSQRLPLYGQLGGGASGPQGDSCTISGPTVTCEDGTSSVVTGPEGPTGKPGPAGESGAQGPSGAPGGNGASCSITDGVITCEDGTSANVRGPKGMQGEKGDKGEPGDSGTKGTSCKIRGDEVHCEDGSSGNVKGPKGEPGIEGDPGDPGPAGPRGGECSIKNDIITCKDGTSGNVTGDMGIPGEKGDKGITGDRGPRGPACYLQANEVICENSTSGNVLGPKGNAGRGGPRGDSCSIAGNIVTCDNGSEGTVIGPKGLEGPQGEGGRQGEPGGGCIIKGTRVTCWGNEITEADLPCDCSLTAPLCITREKLATAAKKEAWYSDKTPHFVKTAAYQNRPIIAKSLEGLHLGNQTGVWKDLYQINVKMGQALLVEGSVVFDSKMIIANSDLLLQIRVQGNQVQARHQDSRLNGLPLYLKAEYVEL